MNPKCLQGPCPEATTCSDVKGAPWGFVLAPSPLSTLLLTFFTLTVPSPVSLLPSLVSPPLPFLSTYILQTPERWGCRGSGHCPRPPPRLRIHGRGSHVGWCHVLEGYRHCSTGASVAPRSRGGGRAAAEQMAGTLGQQGSGCQSQSQVGGRPKER